MAGDLDTLVEAADAAGPPPYARDVAEIVAALGSDADSGLTGAEAAARLSRYGPNEISKEKPPSMWAVAAQQLRDPMNIMLIAVVAVSFVIGEVSTGVIVALLILLNVVLGTRQELKARASIDALANLQVPQAKVVRDGSVALVPAVDLVPGDIVAAGGGRHRPRRRPHRPLGDAGDAGGGSDRRERAGREGRRACSPGRRWRSATARTCCSRTRR